MTIERQVQNKTSRRGYWVALSLVLASIGIAALMFWRLSSVVSAMPRIDARGEHEVTLPAGDVVVFGELSEGVAVTQLRCAARDASGGVLALTAMEATSISYDIGAYHGRSIFELAVPAAGPIKILCETDADLTLAFGKGLGTTMVIGGVLALLVFLSGCVVAIRTFVRRRRERRRAAS